MARRDETRIEINGVVYRSLGEVPKKYHAFAAQFFDDADGDGVPDIVQGPAAASSVTTERSETFIVDGAAYSSIDEVPEAHRAKMARMVDRPSTQPATSGRPSTTERPASIVSKAGLSGRTKMLLAFAAVDAAVVGVVVWLLVR